MIDEEMADEEMIDERMTDEGRNISEYGWGQTAVKKTTAKR